MSLLYTAGPLLDQRPRADSADTAAAAFTRVIESTADLPAWLAGLLDPQSRLLAIAPIARTSARPCVITPRDVYRAVLAFGARRVVLAHCHAACWPQPSELALETTRCVHAMGFELGLDLRDTLLIRGHEHVSLRALGVGVEDWRRARERGEPCWPEISLRLHQAGSNRRPMPYATRHAASALAALWRCPACQRRQNDRRACRYCGEPRPGA
jgi:hypothetical protein